VFKYGLISKNAAIYSISNVILRITSFLLIPIYLNYLSPEEYGLLATILVTVEFTVIIMTLGMRDALIRFFQECEVENKLGTLLASSTLVSIVGGLLVSVICLFILPSFFQKIFHVEKVLQYIILACSSAFVQTLFEHLTSYYRAKNDAFNFACTNVAAALLLVLINCTILMKFNYDAKSPLIAQLLAYGIVFLVVSVKLGSRFGISISGSLTIKLLRFGLPLIFALSGQRIFFPTATYMLSFYSGLTAVAFFSLGMKFASIINMILILPFQMALQPFLFVNLHDDDIKDTISNLLTYFVFTIVVLSMAVFLGTKLILPLIAPPDYFQTCYVLLFALPAWGFLALIVFGEALVNITYKTYVTGIIIGLSSLLGILLNYLLIPPLGWYGAIVSLNISSIVTGTVILSYGIKCYPIPIDWKRIIFSIGLFVLFFLLVFVSIFSSSYTFFASVLMVIVIVVLISRHLRLLDDSEKMYLNELKYNIKTRLHLRKIGREKVK
jgi:O-antigen/teichoic acid export membrane protein